MRPGRFLHRSNERVLPKDYAGDILVWDIDKTYLETRFSSLRDLLRFPLELAVDKADVPGATPVLRALRRGPGPHPGMVPLYFVSGSPVQARGVVERKMTLDGVDFDGITFKDQVGLFLNGQGRYIYRQLGYKLRALLLYRKELPGRARYLFFGDDTEADAEAFALFGEVCAGLRGADLEARLSPILKSWELQEIKDLSNELAVTDNPVDAIFIHLANGTDPTHFGNPRVIATYSYLQTALVLAARGKVARSAIGAVAKTLRRRLVPERDLEEALADAHARLGVPSEFLAEAGR